VSPDHHEKSAGARHIAGKIAFIAVKARQFDAKDIVTIPDEASNVADDNLLSVLRL
jgi:hypothetical protein